MVFKLASILFGNHWHMVGGHPSAGELPGATDDDELTQIINMGGRRCQTFWAHFTSLSSRHHHYHHTKNLKKWILNDEVVGRKVPNVLNHFSSLLIACCTVKMMIWRRFLYWFFVVNWFFVFCCWYKMIQWKKNIVMLYSI